TADEMLRELRQVIPAFLKRVDNPDRGGRWSAYFAETRERVTELAARLSGGAEPESGGPEEVTLTDFDPDGEVKIVAAILYASTALSDAEATARARRLSPSDRAALLQAYIGNRSNRRHKPGRAFERTSYRFDILTDYGAFRDLQRHRLLTLDWQLLST